MHRRLSRSIRHRVAREAASLLYTQQENEYKQAKLHAGKTLGARSLPSNKDIAIELDKIADEAEGSERAARLAQMRKDALGIMVLLNDFHPRLVGSVWRGTAHRNSDVDIDVFALDARAILNRLRGAGHLVRTAQWRVISKGSELERVFQVYMTLASKNEVELNVRSPERECETGICEIYGDTARGLDVHELRRMLLTDPLRKFVPN